MVAINYTHFRSVAYSLLTILLVFLVFPVRAPGELLGFWAFDGTGEVSAVAGHLSAGDVMLSSGTIGFVAGTDDGGSHIGSASSWPMVAFSTAGKSLQFTLTPEFGYKMLITNVTLRLGRTPEGPTSFTAQYSADGFATDGTSAGTGTITSESTSTLDSFVLNAPFDIQADTLTYRLWGHHAAGTGNLRFNNIQINGTVIKPEPSNHATGLSATLTTHRSIILQWTDADGASPPDGYLVRGSRTSVADIPVAVDGQAVANYYTWNNGYYARFVPQGTRMVELNGLAAESTYYFTLFPLSNSGSLIDYKTDGVVAQGGVTTGIAPFEDFEDASKSGYDAGVAGLKSGSWIMDNAVLSGTVSDRKSDQLAVRIRNLGSITMLFNVTGIESVVLDHANYGSDIGGGFVVERSLDGGATWMQVGPEVTCGPTVQTAEFRVHRQEGVCLRIRKTGVADDLNR
ncbi:MAG TPA: hypothetical protein DCS43_09750, partial [Verrucomicrobia bacterium]|nr:hypothetical protein [Verrucomicrobiota bacterium]